MTTIRDSGFSPSTADLEANVDGTRPRRASASGREGGAQGDGGEQDAEEEEPQPAPIPWHVPQPTDPPFLQTQPECRLARLPPEVQLSIFRKLNFGDLERLRRTSQYYRAFLRPEVVAYLHGGPVGLKGAILAHCCRCLAHDPYLNGILLADHSSKDFPLSARCLDCAAQAGEMQVGTKVTLGNFSQAWICRWCGYPIKGTSSYHHAQFHRDCYNKYNDVLLAFFVLGWLQLAIGIVAAALSWRYFRGVVMVFAPTVVSVACPRPWDPAAGTDVTFADILHPPLVLHSIATSPRKHHPHLPLGLRARADHRRTVDPSCLHTLAHDCGGRVRHA